MVIASLKTKYIHNVKTLCKFSNANPVCQNHLLQLQKEETWLESITCQAALKSIQTAMLCLIFTVKEAIKQ